MAIITISRGTFSGGKDLAEGLAARLGYDCLSREIMIEAADRYGVSPDELTAGMENAPRLFERLGRARDRYLAFCRALLCEHALGGKLIYHGHAGHFLLPGIRHVIRVRVIAPMEFRIAAAMKQLSSTRADAVSYIDKVDKERERWTSLLYHVSWGEPEHYDAVLNLEKLGVHGASAIIAALTEQEEFQATDESRAALRDLALKAKCAAALAADSRTADISLDLLVEDGVVTARGWVRLQEQVEAIPVILGAVEGVQTVHPEVGVRSGFLM